MKLGNFLSLDPEYAGTGLTRGGKLDREVWQDFSPDLRALHRTAAAIAQAAQGATAHTMTSEERPDDEEFPEGRILTRLHTRKERNRTATERKKREVLHETGKLACEACDFDFATLYGGLGSGFAECHHTIPLSALTAHHPTRLTDLAILCANCHRMIHRSRPMLSVPGLRALIADRRT
jgi:5-methylcytosine-specific restriction protein A